MHCLQVWNGEYISHLERPSGAKLLVGGVILISHDERFITTVSNELWVCNEGKVQKYYGDVTSYKVGAGFVEPHKQEIHWLPSPFLAAAIDCEQLEGEALDSSPCMSSYHEIVGRAVGGRERKKRGVLDVMACY